MIQKTEANHSGGIWAHDLCIARADFLPLDHLASPVARGSSNPMFKQQVPWVWVSTKWFSCWFFFLHIKPGSYFPVYANAKRIWREWDVMTLLSQRYSQVSRAEFNCCELFVANLWRQHSLRIRMKYELGLTWGKVLSMQLNDVRVKNNLYF